MALNRFAQRAVENFILAAQTGRIKYIYVRNILKYDTVDTTPVEPFLRNTDPQVRSFAVEIIAARGNHNKVIDLALEEQEKEVLLTIFRKLTDRGRGENLERLVNFIDYEDSVVRVEAIMMFKKCGRADCLFTLLFDSDMGLANRVKRYIERENVKENTTRDV